MMVQHLARKLNLTPFMGIALADILANGVAIIMLLIVITISSKYQLEQEKLEQVDEVSRVLSRDIVNSVVMNNISTSPPAVLHDYVNSQNDSDLRHAVMPILELREGRIRDYYNGRSWSRKQLLIQDNSFDAYLSGLDERQLVLLRTDIYEVDMFYIYMSILKDHEIIPRHWHFSVDKSGSSGILAAAGGSDNWSKFFGEEEAGGEGGMGKYLGALGQQGGSSTGYLGFQGGDYPWDVLGGEGEPMEGLGAAQGSQLRLRLASPDSQLQLGQLNFEMLGDGKENFLAGILSYLKFINGELEQRRPIIDVLQDMPRYLQQFIEEPLQLNAYEKQAIVNIAQARLQRELVGSLSQADYLSIGHQQQDGVRGLNLSLPANQVLGTIKVVGDVDQSTYLSSLPKYGNANFHLQNYPELFQGLSMELSPGSILLAADYAVSDQWRWYPVFFIYPEFDDFVMGFIYATIPASGQMLVAAESNRLTVAGYSLHLQREEDSAESEYLLAIIFSWVLLVLFLIYGTLLWRRNRLALSN